MTLAVGDRVRLVGTTKGVGVVLWLVEPKPGWHRALVNWKAEKVDQFVDVDKLVAL